MIDCGRQSTGKDDGRRVEGVKAADGAAMRNHLASILKFDRKPAAILSEFPIGQLSRLRHQRVRVGVNDFAADEREIGCAVITRN